MSDDSDLQWRRKEYRLQVFVAIILVATPFVAVVYDMMVRKAGVESPGKKPGLEPPSREDGTPDAIGVSTQSRPDGADPEPPSVKPTPAPDPASQPPPPITPPMQRPPSERAPILLDGEWRVSGYDCTQPFRFRLQSTSEGTVLQILNGTSLDRSYRVAVVSENLLELQGYGTKHWLEISRAEIRLKGADRIETFTLCG